MKTSRRSRWALSFADLSLLLLGFFVLMQAHRETGRQAAMAGLKTYFGGKAGTSGRDTQDADIPAATLFTAHEAMLTPAGRTRIVALAREATRDGRAVRIASRGLDRGANRFDGWDLASARVGAVARALAEDGIAPNAIRISGPDSVNGGNAGRDVTSGQYILLRTEPLKR